MDVTTLFNQGMEAYDAQNYNSAISYFDQAAKEGSVDGEIFVSLCYFNMAADTSLQASNSDTTEALVKGQQLAVNLTDACIRSCLNFIRRHPTDEENGKVAAFMISRCFGLQYTIIAAGLTTAYRITTTTTHITKHMVNGSSLWDEITGVESDEYVSLYSYDMNEYDLFGPDRRTLRVEQSKETVLVNAVQVASILTYLGREFDALMLRAVIAGEMADCENGVRSMLLAADWFVAMAMQTASQQLTEEQFKEWNEMNEQSFTEISQYKHKYAALLRQMKREGMRPYLNRFYQDPAEVPKIEDCVVYTEYEKNPVAGDVTDPSLPKQKGEWFESFLTIFAQASNQKVIPIVVFPGVFSLIFGGMLREYGVNVLSIIWLVLTLGLTLIRSVKDLDNIVGKSSVRMFMLIRFGIAILFSLNFWLGLIPFVVLKFLSKAYK